MKEDNKLLKFVYTVFLGGLLALFVGLGVSTFYAAPKAPEYPNVTPVSTDSKWPSAEEQKAQKKYDQEYKIYTEKDKTYSRNVSIITLSSSVLLLVISLAFERKIRILSDGIMLGGLFLLVYSIGRGFVSQSQKYTFVAVSVGVAVALILGYHRFVRPEKTK
jgi:hypothetical protein